MKRKPDPYLELNGVYETPPTKEERENTEYIDEYIKGRVR